MRVAGIFQCLLDSAAGCVPGMRVGSGMPGSRQTLWIYSFGAMDVTKHNELIGFWFLLGPSDLRETFEAFGRSPRGFWPPGLAWRLPAGRAHGDVATGRCAGPRLELLELCAGLCQVRGT